MRRSARGRRGWGWEEKKYIARNTSDSAIGVPHTSRMAAAKLLSTAATSRRGDGGQKIRPFPGHFGFIASLTLHRSWKRREGFCRIFIRFECTHEDHSNGFIILIPAGFLGGRVRTRMIFRGFSFRGIAVLSAGGRRGRRREGTGKIRHKNSATTTTARVIRGDGVTPLSRTEI